MRGLRPDLIACGNWWDWGKKGNIHSDSVQTLKEIGEMWIPIEKILDAGLK